MDPPHPQACQGSAGGRGGVLCLRATLSGPGPVAAGKQGQGPEVPPPSMAQEGAFRTKERSHTQSGQLGGAFCFNLLLQRGKLRSREGQGLSPVTKTGCRAR